jgi:hypothetical protein
MKRRTGMLGTSAGTIAMAKPKGALAQMMEAQERDRAIDRAFAMHLGGTAKPRTCEPGCDIIDCGCWLAK